MSSAAAPADVTPPVRDHESAAHRRLRARRAQARFVSRACTAVSLLRHRGCDPSTALLAVAAPLPQALPLPHRLLRLRGRAPLVVEDVVNSLSRASGAPVLPAGVPLHDGMDAQYVPEGLGQNPLARCPNGGSSN